MHLFVSVFRSAAQMVSYEVSLVIYEVSFIAWNGVSTISTQTTPLCALAGLTGFWRQKVREREKSLVRSWYGCRGLSSARRTLGEEPPGCSLNFCRGRTGLPKLRSERLFSRPASGEAGSSPVRNKALKIEFLDGLKLAFY